MEYYSAKAKSLDVNIFSIKTFRTIRSTGLIVNILSELCDMLMCTMTA